MDSFDQHSPAAARFPPGDDDSSWNDEAGADFDAGVALDERTQRPRMYRVLMHNDDYTYREFVIDVLVRHFHKSAAEATYIMLTVHFKGIGECGVFPRDVAETKIAAVTAAARVAGMPLRCTMEPE